MIARFYKNARKSAAKIADWLRFPFPKQGRRELVDMTAENEAFLQSNLNFAQWNCPENMKLLEGFSIRSREEFAYKSKSLVVYFPDEAATIMQQEETAALQAAPSGYSLAMLNGINIGCGDRRISEHLTPVDIMRSNSDETVTGAHHAFLPDALLANPENLPFKEDTLDYIVALHMLEHVSHPAEILRYWGTLLKPGGGIGLVLPDYEYTWDARIDGSQFGHKWNTNVEIFRNLYEAQLKDIFQLEQIGTLQHKISFDVVLRKPGEFVPFSISNATSELSGEELNRLGRMAC